MSSALNVGGDYQGTNAVFLGDRIAPQSVEIRSGSIIVLYKDRRADEAMVTMPLISKTKRLSFEAGRLKEIFPADEDNQLEQGWVTIGHEVRSFLPCRKTEQHWLLGDSPALPEIMATYQQALSDFPPYPPLFMMLAGVSAPLPEDGFGNDYETAFRANQLVEADPQGHCRSEFIVVESPAPSQHINASIKVGGKARGSWYFEGDFPLLLTNAAGQVLAQGFATAQSPWMTNEWVPFTGVLGLYLKEGG
ncbi:Gmad2 immunoglobulin-like domain-containing protein [Desulfuromusa kysingii]|uniref:Gmad2 immunoglobulin-like domain-containing protein n=1 Tax=Desulfuromusa kysingii TaxID=37625 RepID=UPI001587B389|nr:Gmad2 immunoglobulin-like domain-containing protein [Desulfuromusa kysingii]